MRFEVYPGHAQGSTEQRWYWRLRSKNGKITAAGGEAFDSKRNAREAAKRIRSAMGVISVARIDDVDETDAEAEFKATASGKSMPLNTQTVSGQVIAQLVEAAEE